MLLVLGAQPAPSMPAGSAPATANASRTSTHSRQPPRLSREPPAPLSLTIRKLYAIITYHGFCPGGGDMRKGIKRKNYYLDEASIKEAQRVLSTKTETETIQKALELVANEARLARALKDLLDRGKGHVRDPASDG